jgi:AraC family transcriptional regulator
MYPDPRIIIAGRKLLLGMHQKMSVAANAAGQLWSKFGPKASGIPNKASEDRYSLQIYPEGYFANFRPDLEFEKWATVEVSDTSSSDQTLEYLELPGGLYAVFHYRGLSSNPAIFQHIYSQWLPSSPYNLDSRPHFEVLGTKYRNNDPASEEDIWIPIVEK